MMMRDSRRETNGLQLTYGDSATKSHSLGRRQMKGVEFKCISSHYQFVETHPYGRISKAILERCIKNGT